MKFPYASLAMLAVLILAGACSMTQPPSANLPTPPAALMEPPPSLKVLPGTGPVSQRQAVETVAENYGLFHDVADQLVKLQAWVRGVSQ